MLREYRGNEYKPNALEYYLPNVWAELDFIIAFVGGHADCSKLFKHPAG
jgi:hypothetical protein